MKSTYIDENNLHTEASKTQQETAKRYLRTLKKMGYDVSNYKVSKKYRKLSIQDVEDIRLTYKVEVAYEKKVKKEYSYTGTAEDYLRYHEKRFQYAMPTSYYKKYYGGVSGYVESEVSRDIERTSDQLTNMYYDYGYEDGSDEDDNDILEVNDKSFFDAVISTLSGGITSDEVHQAYKQHIGEGELQISVDDANKMFSEVIKDLISEEEKNAEAIYERCKDKYETFQQLISDITYKLYNIHGRVDVIQEAHDALTSLLLGD